MPFIYKINLEIPIFLLTLCFLLSENVTQNFIIYRTCTVIFNFNISDCKLLGTNNATEEIHEIEQKVQPVASVIMMSRSVIDILISVFCNLILGPWSTKHGRKPVFILSFTAYFITHLLLTLISYIEGLSPWWWLTTITTAIGGGFCTLLTIVYCYISDTSTEENRAVKMAIMELSFSMGTVLGMFASSYVFDAIGYIGIYGTTSVLTFLGLLYIIIFIPESAPSTQQENKIKDLFDVSLVLKTMKSCFKPRPNKDRLLLGLMITFFVIYTFNVFSVDSIFFLYLREKLNWSLQMYTLFSAACNLIDLVTMFFIVYILHKLLKVNDMVIVLFEFLAVGISCIFYGLANSNLYIYIGGGFKRLATGITPLTRTAISKIVPPEDLGEVFAFLSAIAQLVQVISSPLYTLLYNSTISTQPGIFNFLFAGCIGLNMILTSAVIIIRRCHRNDDEIPIME